MRKVNLHAPEFDHRQDREGFRWQGVRVGRAIGGDQIGASLYELPDGESTYPYHLHHGTEEWLLVVAGTPLLRTPDGEQVLREGDLVCFPPGPDGAHRLTGPGTILLLSAASSPDVVEYPDSGKIGARPKGTNYRAADTLDYWWGE